MALWGGACSPSNAKNGNGGKAKGGARCVSLVYQARRRAFRRPLAPPLTKAGTVHLCGDARWLDGYGGGLHPSRMWAMPEPRFEPMEANMSRYTPVTSKAEMPPEFEYVFDQAMDVFGRIRGPFSMLLHSRADRAPAADGAVSCAKPDRRPKLRQVAILTAVRERDANYVWAAQVDVARRVGLREQVIDLLRAKGDPSHLPPGERDIVLYMRQLTQANRVRASRVRCVEEPARRAVAGRTDHGGELLRGAVWRGERL